MTSRFDTQDPIEPMTVGNVVNTGFRLYTSNWKVYLRLAALSTLWATIPWLVLLPIVAFFLTTQDALNLLFLVVPAWIVLSLFCFAQYLGDATAIARLAFNELTNQDEPLPQTRRFTGKRKWSLLLLNLLIGLILTVLLVVLYLLAAISIIAIFAAMGGTAFLLNPAPAAAVNPTLVVLSILIILAVVLIFLVLMIWFGVRFAVADLPLAVEPRVTATDAISRSWELTRSNVWRVFLIFTVTTIIAIPLQAVVQVAGTVIQEGLTTIVPEDSFAFIGLTTILSTIVSLLLGIVLLPLWQSMKAVIYYDLRSRREGIDITLRDLGDRLPPT
ncbi:MAG: glycerophosphoryl diester phosphodiesterase membrane domain-containing protein [Cyanobacteria bacterium J06638_22]